MFPIHHIGIVVKNIDAYLDASPYERSTEIVYDPTQHSRICMLRTGEGETPIELIEPIDEKSTTYQFLKKHGNGTHHICYQAEREADLGAYLKTYKMKQITVPKPAVVFDDRKVVFAYSRTQGIVEFLIMN